MCVSLAKAADMLNGSNWRGNKVDFSLSKQVGGSSTDYS